MPLAFNHAGHMPMEASLDNAGPLAWKWRWAPLPRSISTSEYFTWGTFTFLFLKQGKCRRISQDCSKPREAWNQEISSLFYMFSSGCMQVKIFFSCSFWVQIQQNVPKSKDRLESKEPTHIQVFLWVSTRTKRVPALLVQENEGGG